MAQSSMAQSSSSENSPWLAEVYAMIKVAGTGRTATVYRAKAGGTDRSLAVKVFNKARIVTQEMQRREVIKTEADLHRAAQHGPHILPVGIVRFLDDPTHNVELPMKYFEFISIPEWHTTVLTQMLKALEFLHSEAVSIIHRDVNSQNILFTNLDHFYLADFGHARHAFPHPVGHSGVLEYMAPEMYDAEPQTTAADIWSLGIVCMDMMGFLPDTCPSHDFRSMKRRQWCQAMVEFAENLNKPEVEAMVRIEAHTRPSASQLLQFLELSSTTILGGVQVPPEFFQQVLRLSCPRGTVNDDRPRPLTGKRAESLIGMPSLNYNIQDVEPNQDLGPAETRDPPLYNPSTMIRWFSIRWFSIPKARAARLPRRSIGSFKSAVMLPPRSSGGVRGPSSFASASSPIVQGTGGPQSAIATPPPTGSQATGDPTTTAAISRPTQSQKPTQSEESTPSQESTRPPSAGVTQNPTQRSRTTGTQTHQKLKAKHTQTTNPTTRARHTQTTNPTTNDADTQTMNPTTKARYTQTTNPTTNDADTQTMNPTTKAAKRQTANPPTRTTGTQTPPLSLRREPAQQTPTPQGVARSLAAELSLTTSRSAPEPSDPKEQAERALARAGQSTSSSTRLVQQKQADDGRGRSSRQLSPRAPPWDPAHGGKQPIRQGKGERSRSSDPKALGLMLPEQASAQLASPQQTPHSQLSAQQRAPRPRSQQSSPHITSQQNRAVTAHRSQPRQYQPMSHPLQRSPAQQNPIHPEQWSPGYAQPVPVPSQPIPLYPHVVLSPIPPPPILSPQGPLFPVVVYSPVPP